MNGYAIGRDNAVGHVVHGRTPNEGGSAKHLHTGMAVVEGDGSVVAGNDAD